jgi:hypothetical protein
MSETPEKKKKARLRYDNVFKTAWTDEFHFIKHSRKGNKFAFCEFCRTDFSINHGGYSDVTKHVGTAKHKGNAKDVQSSRSLAMFLPGSSKSSTLLDIFLSNKKKKNVKKILELVQGYWKFCTYNQRQNTSADFSF